MIKRQFPRLIGPILVFTGVMAASGAAKGDALGLAGVFLGALLVAIGVLLTVYDSK